jgi:signal transduction histidine kinase
VPSGDLGARLDELGRRMASEWRAPVAIRVEPPDLIVPGVLDHTVVLLVHEAVVNALKHAHPSRVSVNVSQGDDALRIAVSDDGAGFTFRGRQTHGDLERSGAGPVSLRERVAALGGELSVESSPSGSRVELSLPLAFDHVR